MSSCCSCYHHTVTKQDSALFSNLISKVNSKDKISSLNHNGKGGINLRNGASIIVTQSGNTVRQNNDETKDEKTSQSNNSPHASHPRTKWDGYTQVRQRKYTK